MNQLETIKNQIGTLGKNIKEIKENYNYINDLFIGDNIEGCLECDCYEDTYFHIGYEKRQDIEQHQFIRRLNTKVLSNDAKVLTIDVNRIVYITSKGFVVKDSDNDYHIRDDRKPNFQEQRLIIRNIEQILKNFIEILQDEILDYQNEKEGLAIIDQIIAVVNKGVN